MARQEKKTPEQWYQEILSAAQSLFITKGYEETSVNDIMNSVGGAKGMFYRSFQSKDELLNVLVDKWAEQYVKEVSFALYDSTSTFVEKFIHIMDTIKQMSEKTEGLETFFKESDKFLLRKLTEEMTAKLIPPLSAALQSSMAEGVLSIENADFYANYIIHGAIGALNFGDGTPKEKISKNLRYLPQIIANTLRINLTDLNNTSEV